MNNRTMLFQCLVLSLSMSQSGNHIRNGGGYYLLRPRWTTPSVISITLHDQIPQKPNPIYIITGFANFIDEWSQCDFCFTNFGVILEYLESSITTEKAIFRLSSTWPWHVYTIVRDTQGSCGGLLTLYLPTLTP